MFLRQANILKSNSFFLFGARGTGKTTLLQQMFAQESNLWFDLLEASLERRFSESPDRLSQQLLRAKPLPHWVIIDEVQKVPRLLDVIHKEIESRGVKFALTGSSARKLRRGGANLLAGRAFVYHLYPLTSWELGDKFDLETVVHWGSLPRVLALTTVAERQLFLESYANSYLREEILIEQLVRNIVPFRKFLEIAAQSNGTVINMSRIAEDISTDPKTVRTYFEILEDTLLGFFLPANACSLRKQVLQAPKFYLFDCGVKHALDGTIAKKELTSQEFGRAFEHFLICELHRMNDYTRARYKFSHLRTKGGLEIDIVAERSGEPPIFIEIKASEDLHDRQLARLRGVKKDAPNAKVMCLCREPYGRVVDGLEIVPWQEGLRELFA